MPSLTHTEKRIAFFHAFSQFVIQAKEQGIDLLITDVFRTPEQQHACFLAGKSNCDGYIKRSPHQEWMAIDAYIFRNGEIVWDDCPEYQTLGKLWKDMGMTWGGDFTDPKLKGDLAHFEFRDSVNA